MRYLFLVMLLLVAVTVTAQEPDWLTELIAILQEYETATTELKLDLELLTVGLSEAEKGLEESQAALTDLNAQTNDLEISFTAYKTETAEETRKLKIGLFAMGAACILSLIFAIIT